MVRTGMGKGHVRSYEHREEVGVKEPQEASGRLGKQRTRAGFKGHPV